MKLNLYFGKHCKLLLQINTYGIVVDLYLFTRLDAMITFLKSHAICFHYQQCVTKSK
ncbi:hypothetical protein HanPI659440_Chr06g0235551 [Helianthus annuus]|nr:hypothetical protein HanPI659440_Chr06g0235551 [Helianthus annuus]